MARRPRGAQARRLRDLAEPLPRPRGLGWPRARAGLPAQQGRGRLRGAALALGVGRPRPAADLPGHLLPGGVAVPRAARLLRDRPRHVHAHPVRLRHRRAEEALRAGGPARRRGLVPALLRAGRRLRSGRAAHARRARRRRLGDQRPEDLDLGRALGRLGDPGRAQRPQDGQAQGPHLLLPLHEVAGHRDPADQADLGRVALQRGLLHRRAHPRHPAPRRGRRGLGRGHHHADERAPHLGRPARARLRGDLRPRPRHAARGRPRDRQRGGARAARRSLREDAGRAAHALPHHDRALARGDAGPGELHRQARQRAQGAGHRLVRDGSPRHGRCDHGQGRPPRCARPSRSRCSPPRAAASRRAPTRSCATSSRSACSACPRTYAWTAICPSTSSRPAT